MCPGGRVTGPDWTGCPELSEDSEEIFEELNSIASNHNSGPGFTITSPEKTKLDAEAVTRSIMDVAKQANQVVLDQYYDEDSSDDEESEILASEIENLKIQFERAEQEASEQKLAKAKADRKEHRRQTRKKLEEEKAELIRRTKDIQLSAAPKPVTKSPKQHVQDASDRLHRKAAELASRQQAAAADRQKDSRAGLDNLTIGSIRSLPGASDDVGRLLAGLQALVPSLAKTPSAPSATTFQPSGVFNGQVPEEDELDPDFVFHQGRGKLVRVVHSPVRGNQQETGATSLSRPQVSEDITSEDEECDIVPPPGFCFIWKRDCNGEKYFVKKKLENNISPAVVTGYVCDEATGRWYKREVPRTQGRQPAVLQSYVGCDGKTRITPKYRDHRQATTSPVPLVLRGVRTPTASAPLAQGERVPGIVPIDSAKQGKSDKEPDRIQWAKNCPVNWTNKVTDANINLSLWAWSYITEILSTRTGMAPNLERGELEARLQHFCHVLEITLQTSSLADFGGDSWAVARLYDRKVQQKVDTRLFSWVQLSAMNNGGSLPHELIAATQELGRKPKGGVGGRGGDGKTADGKSGDGRAKGKDNDKDRKSGWKCPSWNYSETRGKCRFELDFPREKCNRVHECSWCKSKQLTPLDHQRHFCRKRLAEEEE